MNGLVVNKKHFNKQNFRKTLQSEYNRILNLLRVAKNQEAKLRLNTTFQIFVDLAPTKELEYLAVLKYFRLLNFYGQQARSEITLDNVINKVNSEEYSSVLKSKYPVQTKLVLSEAYFNKYIERTSPPKPGESPLDNIEILLKAKYYVSKLFQQHLEKKLKLNEDEINDSLSLLAGICKLMFRWFEPLYFSNRFEFELQINPNSKYLRTLVLEEIKNNTCLNYNELLLLEIIDSAKEAQKAPSILSFQVAQLKVIERKNRMLLKDYGARIADLRKHKNGIAKNNSDNSPYYEFCMENELYLNEHSYFCSCKLGKKDNIVIRTHHRHTQIEWVSEFQITLDILEADFNLARLNYYKSLEDSDMSGYQIKTLGKDSPKERMRNSLLVNSFKTCYSILDKIGLTVLDALGYVKPNSQERDIYFLNMWELDFFTTEHYNRNIYLLSLYCIAHELNNNKYAALSEFKRYRNLFEHNRYSIIKENKKAKSEIIRNELIEKTMSLLLITKSAILSYVYFIRNQSIIKAKASC